MAVTPLLSIEGLPDQGCAIGGPADVAIGGKRSLRRLLASTVAKSVAHRIADPSHLDDPARQRRTAFGDGGTSVGAPEALAVANMAPREPLL